METRSTIVAAAPSTRILFWDHDHTGPKRTRSATAIVVAWEIVDQTEGATVYPITANDSGNTDLNLSLRQGRLFWAVEGT